LLFSIFFYICFLYILYYSLCIISNVCSYIFSYFSYATLFFLFCHVFLYYFFILFFSYPTFVCFSFFTHFVSCLIVTCFHTIFYTIFFSLWSSSFFSLPLIFFNPLLLFSLFFLFFFSDALLYFFFFFLLLFFFLFFFSLYLLYPIWCSLYLLKLLLRLYPPFRYATLWVLLVLRTRVLFYEPTCEM
jgi:hypothetical protein